MIRKITAASFICLAASTSAWADGFYLGLGAGPEAQNFNQTAYLTVQPPGSTSANANVKDATHLSGTGVFASLFGGYGWSKNKYYLAAEINANASAAEFNSNNSEFISGTVSTTSYLIRNSFGLSLLPGYHYTPATLFYARLGYANGNFVISTSDSSIANINRNLSGIRYGLGVNHSFTQHIGLRMEYSQISYQTTAFTVQSGPALKRTIIAPTTGQVEFSLIYNFA